MVHGRCEYMVACGPRAKGSTPGVAASAAPGRSSTVYTGLMRMPSAVGTPRSAASLPASLAASFFQVSRAGFDSFAIWRRHAIPNAIAVEAPALLSALELPGGLEGLAGLDGDLALLVDLRGFVHHAQRVHAGAELV